MSTRISKKYFTIIHLKMLSKKHPPFCSVLTLAERWIQSIGHDTLAAITGTSIVVPHLPVKVTLCARSSNELQWLDLTHWGRVTHICVSKIIIIGSDNGLSPNRRQAIIWTNAGILLIGPLGTNFSEILIETFSYKKMRLKTLSAKWRLFFSASMC